MVESGCPGGSDELAALAIRTRMIYLCGQDKQGSDMVEAAFNTIAEIQRLRDAGFEQKQAEAITLSIHAGVTGGVATKADVDAAELRLDGKIELVRKDVDLVRTELDGKIDSATAELDSKIERAKFDLTWRLVGAVAVLNGLLLALTRYLNTLPTG